MHTESNSASSHTTKPARLLAAARQIFAKKGYYGETVREIVAVAGVIKDRKMGITQKRFPEILRIIFNGIAMDGVRRKKACF